VPITPNRQIRRVRNLWCWNAIFLDLALICARSLQCGLSDADGGIGEYARKHWPKVEKVDEEAGSWSRGGDRLGG
jgi:hypothetical protein